MPYYAYQVSCYAGTQPERNFFGGKQKFGGEQRKFLREQSNVFRQEMHEIMLKMTLN